MRRLWWLLAVCLALGAAEPEFRTRRDALRNALPDGVAVVFGNTESGSLRLAFSQNPNFFYLTGWDAPGGILLLDPEREILFLPKRDAAREKWAGRVAAQDDPDIREVTGFETVLPPGDLETELNASLKRYPKIYAAGQEDAGKLKALAPGIGETTGAESAIARLRMKKSAREIALLQHSADISIAAHRAAWRRIAPGLFEYQIAASMASVYLEKGCAGGAYPPSIASGPSALALHYSRNARRMQRGELAVVDVGAECAGYAADITRTIPVSGVFNPRQRELYNIVLGAQKAAISAVKPGAYISSRTKPGPYKAAFEYINSHGKDLKGEPLGKYFVHGISHHVGLDVQDASDNSIALEAGMVITVEPGIYIPEEGIGIRIEDMVLVTSNGARVMTSALPKEAAAIEGALRR